MKKLLFGLLSCLLFFSCSTENEVEAENEVEIEPENEDNSNSIINEEISLLLKKTYVDGEIWSQYEYNEDNRLSKAYSDFENGEHAAMRDINYVEDSLFISIYNSDNLLTNFVKVYELNDLQLREDVYNSENEMVSHFIYSYDPNSFKITSKDFFSFGVMHQKKIYNHSSANRNYNTIDFEDDTLDVIFSREYIIDDNKDAYESVDLHAYFNKDFSLKGNILSRTQTEKYGSIEEDRSYSSEYIYNEEGYPASRITTYLDGTINEIIFEYY